MTLVFGKLWYVPLIQPRSARVRTIFRVLAIMETHHGLCIVALSQKQLKQQWTYKRDRSALEANATQRRWSNENWTTLLLTNVPLRFIISEWRKDKVSMDKKSQYRYKYTCHLQCTALRAAKVGYRIPTAGHAPPLLETRCRKLHEDTRVYATLSMGSVRQWMSQYILVVV